MDKYSIPRYLDDPFKIAFLTIDEIMALVIPLLLGLFMFNAPLFGIIVGCCFMLGVKAIKGDEGHYFMYHVAYWYLPQFIKYHSTPPSHIREILG